MLPGSVPEAPGGAGILVPWHPLPNFSAASSRPHPPTFRRCTSASSSSTVPWGRTCSCSASAPTTSAARSWRGCNEWLVETRPDVVAQVHRSFYEVGCDVVETDTFGSTSVVLAEYGLADQAAT